MSVLSSAIMRGTLAARPAASASTAGRLYYVTDTGTNQGWWRDNGTTWEQCETGTVSASSSNTFVPRSPLRNFSFGVATHIAWGQSTSTFSSELDRHLADGVRVVRSDVSWRNIETSKGVYDSTELGRIDNAVQGTLKRGQILVLTLFEVPDWAHSGTTDHYSPPDNMQDFTDFCTYLAGRYVGAEHLVWELWNEPSLFGTSGTYFWNPFGRPSPLGGTYPSYSGTYATDETTAANAYADMAYYMNKGLNAVAPHHFVLGGCMHVNDPNFLTKVYQRLSASWSGAKIWDAVSIHPYCSNKDPYDTTTQNASFLLGITDTRNTMDTYNDNGPIWITEFGYNTAASAGSPLPGADDAARDTVRGDYFEKCMDIVRQYPYVECFCAFTPSPVETVSTTYDFSLYKSGANLSSYNRILAKWRSMQGGRVAATAAVAASGYSVGSASWWPVVFKGTDTEDTNNMHYLQDTNITGQVTRTAGSPTLVGTATAFLTDLGVGQCILIGTSTYVVTAIASNTSCTVSPTPTSNDVSAQSAQRRADYVVAPYAGAYSVVGWFQIPANATGIRMARLNVNGTAVMTQGPISGNATYPTGFAFSAKLNLKQWDRVSMDVYQDSGASQTIPASTAGLSLVKDGPVPW